MSTDATDIPPYGLHLTEVTSQAAAEVLLRRLQAGTRAATGGQLGGWPPYASLIPIVGGWLAEFGLHIDNDAVRAVEDG